MFGEILSQVPLTTQPPFHSFCYISNGKYYGRIKVNGKVIRESLQTTVWTRAKLRLTDFLKEHQEARHRVDPPKFKEAVELFKQDLERQTGIKPKSKEYRLVCLQKIQSSWPDEQPPSDHHNSDALNGSQIGRCFFVSPWAVNHRSASRSRESV